VNGFNSVVIFTLVSSQGLLANIVPQTVTGPGTAILFLSSATPGSFTVIVTGTSGSLVHSVAILVTVEQPPPPDFGITASNLTITAGSSANSTITLSSINGFNGPVTLSFIVSSTSITGTLSTITVQVPRSGSVSAILTVLTFSSTLPGTYNVTINGVNGNIFHSTTIFVAVKMPNPCAACDINGDGVVGLDDLNFVLAHFGTNPTSSNWDPRADLNHDGRVDIIDVVKVAGCLGAKVSNSASQKYSNNRYNLSIESIVSAYMVFFTFTVSALVGVRPSQLLSQRSNRRFKSLISQP
ncbi:MAG TPA: dockerin type I domain-containing protein, partial [Candidatus Binatus sp.]|nr:dockerin type I domain-containing protein [Candidatus Binatus sp.]